MSGSSDLAARARLVLTVAEDLERRRYAFAGVVRDLARAVLDGRLRQVEPDGCPRCGAAVEQPARGRPRVYCSPRCRWSASKRRRNARLTSVNVLDREEE